MIGGDPRGEQGIQARATLIQGQRLALTGRTEQGDSIDAGGKNAAYVVRQSCVVQQARGVERREDRAPDAVHLTEGIRQCRIHGFRDR